MQLFGKKAKSKGRVGLMINEDSIAIAYLESRRGEPRLISCQNLALESAGSAGKMLEKLVKQMNLEGEQCSYVLNPRDYNLLLVEAPNVEPEELRSAVRWKIKDLLDIKVEDAAIDTFPVPEDAYRGRKMVYVVAVLKSRIKSIVEMVDGSGMELAIIDIPELAMKNYSSLLIEDSQAGLDRKSVV